MNRLEIAANAFVAVAIFLAGRNNVHTWWTGIVAHERERPFKEAPHAAKNCWKLAAGS